MKHIREIAEVAGVDEKYLEQYGNYKAKVDYSLLKESDRKDVLSTLSRRSWVAAIFTS